MPGSPADSRGHMARGPQRRPHPGGPCVLPAVRDDLPRGQTSRSSQGRSGEPQGAAVFQLKDKARAGRGRQPRELEGPSTC